METIKECLDVKKLKVNNLVDEYNETHPFNKIDYMTAYRIARGSNGWRINRHKMRLVLKNYIPQEVINYWL